MSVWDRLDDRWPACVGGKRVSFPSLREEMHGTLGGIGICPRGFSHLGVVVKNTDASLADLARITGAEMPLTHRAWVEAYQVHVARGIVEGAELELIEPVGQSFFGDALNAGGDGLQHVAFRVEDIEDCLKKQKTAGMDLVNEEPASGSHGKIAFSKPVQFAPVHLELVEPSEG